MKDIEILIWLFPILFIFHDFEEIIFMQGWIGRNKAYMQKRFPRLAKRMLPHFESITTSSFALGVAEEFVLISIITMVSYLTNWYALWIGLFMAFSLHLVMHCIQAVVLRGYVPAVITSLICLPACFYILNNTVQLYNLDTLIQFSILGVLLMIANLAVIHKGMNSFSRWAASYENQCK